MVPAPLPPPAPRRVSYVLPPPSTPPPTLGLPPWGVSRQGHTSPLYTQRPPGPNARSTSHFLRQEGDHPRHRLAVQALALDLSTALSTGTSGSDGEPAPGGILYTGGRDGLVSAWELGLPTRRRRRAYGRAAAEDERRPSSDSDSSMSDGEDDPPQWRHGTMPADLESLGGRPMSASRRPRRRLDSVSTQRGRASSADTATRGTEKLDTDLPIEERWEVDQERARITPAPPHKFRQCIQSHTDWVNDVVLCNYNRTVVSASSDSLLIAWNPHSSNDDDQVTLNRIGRHGDYVRCLASARDAGWVASGGFDRKIKIWDITEGRSGPALELPSPPASIYSLSATPSGSLIAAGTPERVVRVWDPSSRRQVSRLGGHTDNIRAVLLSDDGKWVLSASSDATVKLWSLTAQRCLHTFSHHTSSVWSLFSQHPTLERFYSGDRTGNICKIDIEGAGDPGNGECIVLARDGPDESGDMRMGYEGVTQIVGKDDSWLWSAGGSSSVKRWRDVPPRSQRARAISARPITGYVNLDGLMSTSESNEALLGRRSPTTPPPPPDSPSSQADRGGDKPSVPSVSFFKDLTAPLSRTTSSPSPQRSTFPGVTSHNRPSSVRTRPTPSASAIRAPRLSIDSYGTTRPHSGESTPAVPQPISPTLAEIPYDALVPLTSPDDTYFSPRTRDPEDSATIDTLYSSSVISVPYNSSSTRRSTSQIRSQSLAETVGNDPESQAAHAARREYFQRESASEATPLRSSPDDVIEGRVGLTRCELLNDRRHALTVDTEGGVALWDIVQGRCLGVFSPDDLAPASRRPSDAHSTLSGASGSGGSAPDSPEDLLAFVKERIEGEASTATWCKCDTRVGALTVHLEESRVFDAEVYVDEAHLGPIHEFPSDHRLYLGKWVLRQLFAGFIEAEMQLRAPRAVSEHPDHSSSAQEQLVEERLVDHPRFISLANLGQVPTSPRGAKTPGMTIFLATPAIRRAHLPPIPIPTLHSSPRSALWDFGPIPASPTGAGQATPRPFEGTTGLPTPTGARTPTGSKPGAGGLDYFSLPPTSEPPKAEDAPVPPSPLPTPGGTLMGRLRLLGKGSKRPTTGEIFEPVTTDASASEPVVRLPSSTQFQTVEEQQQQQILDAVFSSPLTPCPLVDAPPLGYNEDMAILISEDTADGAAWGVTYRGLVSTGHEDASILEQKAPFWLLDFLLSNRIPQKEPVKISFVILPWIDTVRAGLPELPNANARLTANRSLRMRKVMGYIADKLELRDGTKTYSRSASISGGDMNNSPHPTPTPSSDAVHLQQHHHPRQPDSEHRFVPEEELEILCGDVLLTSKMTLATARTFYWRGGGDLVLSYRIRLPFAVVEK